MSAMPAGRVHFLEFNAKVNTLGSGVVLPKYGTPLLAAILKQRGYDVRIFLEGVSPMEFGPMTDCSVVCFPVYAPALNKVRQCAQRIRRERPGLPIVMGGPQACMYPDTVVGLCDVAVRGEADELLPEIIRRLLHGEDPRQLPGVSYCRDGELVHNPDAVPPAIPPTAPDPTLIVGLPERPTRFGRHHVLNLLQTSRGCKFQCRFCPTSKLFGGVYRNRDPESIIQDIRRRIRFGRLFLVVDNSFLSNRQQTMALLARLAEEDLGVFLIVFERHEIGRDDEMLRLMWKAGVRAIIVGIESLDDASLEFYDKRQTREEVVRSVENILAHGMQVIGTFVLGGDNDTPDRAESIARFVRQTRIIPNLFVVHDVEQDASKPLLIPLDRRFETHYRRRDPDDTGFYDYYTGNFVTYFPKRMRPSTLQQCMSDLYRELFSFGNIARRVLSPNLFDAMFGVGHGFAMKRLSRNVLGPVSERYIEFLREIEDGLYEVETLCEDRLAAIDALPAPPPVENQVDSDAYRLATVLCVMPGLARFAGRRFWRRLRAVLAPATA